MRVFKDSESPLHENNRAVTASAPPPSGLAEVKCLLAVASARGGTGKSAITVNLAMALAHLGSKVGILDADFNSPSVLAMLGMKPARRPPFSEWIEPSSGPSGLRLVASDLIPDPHFVPPDFGEIQETIPSENNGHPSADLGYSEALATLLHRTRFGALDLLLIDLAPGLESLARLIQLAQRAAILVISHPSEQSARASAMMLEFAASKNVSIYGIIENMVGFHCDRCHSVRPLMHQGGIAAIASAARVPLLERFPFDPRLSETTDRGVTLVREYPEVPLAKELIATAQNLKRALPALAAAQNPNASSLAQSLSSNPVSAG
jgi:ATP-binding protein involved in chromosome partitioning